jgi:hypothetical protein
MYVNRFYSSKSGYIDNNIMNDHFMNVIFPAIWRKQEIFKKRGVIPTACLLVDGHSTRRNPSLWHTAKEMHLDVFLIPAYTFHLIQPLDRCFFVCLKKYHFIFYFFTFFFYFFILYPLHLVVVIGILTFLFGCLN